MQFTAVGGSVLGAIQHRWTSAEYGRALAKGVSVLRIGWPDCTPSPRTATAHSLALTHGEINSSTGELCGDVITRICQMLEAVRVESHAVRNINLVSNLRNSIEKIQGRFIGAGVHKAIYIELANGKKVVAYPTVGVPTSTTLHDASMNSPNQSVAVVYDHIGLHPNWLGHLDWLGSHIRSARCVKSSEAAWQFADWEDRL